MADILRRFLLLPIALAGLASASPARADSWAAPHRTTYHSANRTARLIVTPHIPADRNLWPFSQEPRGPSAPDMAGGVLQRRDARGRWRTQWQGQLRNPVMPVSALVADSGRYFVTFDDWGGTGTGPNVVVIYDGAGRVIRALSILDLLPEHYVRTLAASFSSLYWRGEPSFSADGETLQLSLALPGAGIFPGGYFPHTVTLATGEPGARAGAEWDRAMAVSAAWRVAERERRAAYHTFMTEPLSAPTSADAQGWAAFLDEAFKRLAPDWNRNNPSNILIGVSTSGLTWRSTSNPGEFLLSRNPPAAIMIASPTGTAIAPALAQILSARPGGWLSRTRLYIVANDAAWPDLVRLLTPSGATLIQVDPAEPIQQRPERLREHLEFQAILTRNESAQD